MTAPEITCTGCKRKNRAHRGYCGRCGASLQPVCRGCHFVNEAGDVYCGGCGNTLVLHAGAGAAAVPPPRMQGLPTPPRPPKPPTPARGPESEVSALFMPAQTASPDDQLPAANITQADLDRLFGGGT